MSERHLMNIAGVNGTKSYWSSVTYVEGRLLTVDSTTALDWIRRQSEWGSFLDNRVKEALELTLFSKWGHVPVSPTSVDFHSRGISTLKLVRTRWWEEPDWLKLEESYWLSAKLEVDEERSESGSKKNLHSSFNFQHSPLVLCLQLLGKESQDYG